MSGYKVKVNDRTIRIEKTGDKIFLDGKPFDVDETLLRTGHYHILHERKSYEAEVIEHHPEEKAFSIRVNNNTYRLIVSDRYDELLQTLGMDPSNQKKVNDVKAPMPGLVLRVMVEAGQQIRKGDSLLVLEAMKMENILKSPADGVVKKIFVTTGDKVEKNQVMVNMD